MISIACNSINKRNILTKHITKETQLTTTSIYYKNSLTLFYS